jgi:small subunit ribosomal protein S9
MAGKKSLSDLGELTNPKPEAPAAAEPASEAAASEAPAEAAAPSDDQGASTQGPQIQAVLRE